MKKKNQWKKIINLFQYILKGTLIFVQKLSSYYSKNGEKKGSESIFVFSFIGTHGFLFFKNINSSLETYKDSKITEVLDL